MLVEIIKNILENEKLIEKLISLDSMVEVYEFCKENGYTEDYETFKKETEEMLKNSKLSENDLVNIAGGKSQRINKAIAGTLAALSLTSASEMTPSTFATEGNSSSSSKQSTILNKIKENLGTAILTAGLTGLCVLPVVGFAAEKVEDKIIIKIMKIKENYPDKKGIIKNTSRVKKIILENIENLSYKDTLKQQDLENKSLLELIELLEQTLYKTTNLTNKLNIIKFNKISAVLQSLEKEIDNIVTNETKSSVYEDFDGCTANHKQKVITITKNMSDEQYQDLHQYYFYTKDFEWSVTIGDNVTVNKEAFENARIDNLTIENVAEIKERAFSGAIIIGEVTIKETNKEKLQEIATALLNANFGKDATVPFGENGNYINAKEWKESNNKYII